jgi:hypothetical protein
MESRMLTVVNIKAGLFRNMIPCNPKKTNNTSESYNIGIWKFKLDL